MEKGLGRRDMSNQYEIINKYANMLSHLEYDIGEPGKIMIVLNDKIYETALGVNFNDLKEEDVVLVKPLGDNPLCNILSGSKNIRAIIVSNTPYCSQVREKNTKMDAVLDDMAQIVGSKVTFAKYNTRSIKRALRKATSCFVVDGFTISTGRTLYEAIVAMTVLEKSAEVYLKSEILGGGKKIPGIEASLMRYIYKKKYSRIEESVKEQEIRGI